MIALAVTCLLIVAALLALLSATDSLMRGWHSYGALAQELRALRAMPQEASAGMRCNKARVPATRSVRRPARSPHSATAHVRAAA